MHEVVWKVVADQACVVMNINLLRVVERWSAQLRVSYPGPEAPGQLTCSRPREAAEYSS